MVPLVLGRTDRLVTALEIAARPATAFRYAVVELFSWAVKDENVFVAEDP